MNLRWIGFYLVLLGLSGSSCSFNADGSFDSSFKQPISTVRFKDQAIVLTAYYADTAAEQALGLGDVAALGETESMLFSYVTDPTQPSFWMKGVEYPIDIIWVSHNQVTGITANVQPEAKTTALADYVLYPAPGLVDWVVEVPAGLAQTHNIAVGDTFQYSLPE